LTTANKSRKKALSPVEIQLDLPADIFDDDFREEDFRARVRELAILELVRLKRLHEHEAQRMLGVWNDGSWSSGWSGRESRPLKKCSTN
jgi:hypothetical protein